MLRLAHAPRYNTACALPRIVPARHILRDGLRHPNPSDLYHSSYALAGDPAVLHCVMEDDHYHRPLARTIALEELRAHAGKELKGMALLRPGNRLSITPVEAAHWKFILSLE